MVDRLFVGRKCAGIEQGQRIIIDDPTASRVHFEIRLDPARDRAYIIDTSTNGTFLNGGRLERASPQQIRPGDRITVGDTHFEFRSGRFLGAGAGDSDDSGTVSSINLSTMVMVAGDVTNYSTISQVTKSEVLASSLKVLFAGLTSVLTSYRGTLSHYAGDALFAVWEVRHIPAANELAIDFVLAADAKVREISRNLPLRGPAGAPVRMGWGVVRGPAAVVALPHSTVSVLGDATNLAFRLSGLAGREGRPSVLVSQSARDEVADLFRWGAPAKVSTKGRGGLETVYPVFGRVATPR